MKIVKLAPDHLRAHMRAYVEISEDVSDWAAENFLLELPGKWELSFSLWNGTPVAYCILSRKFGPVHIHQFMVTREKRGGGIGTFMLREALHRGAETLKILSTNQAAILFYKRHGFLAAHKHGDYLWLRYKLQDGEHRT